MSEEAKAPIPPARAAEWVERELFGSFWDAMALILLGGAELARRAEPREAANGLWISLLALTALAIAMALFRYQMVM